MNGLFCGKWFDTLAWARYSLLGPKWKIGIAIFMAEIPCGTPYVSSISPYVNPDTGATSTIGMDLKFPMNVEMSFKFWQTKPFVYCVLAVPVMMWGLEALISLFTASSKLPFPYQMASFFFGFSMNFQDWGKMQAAVIKLQGWGFFAMFNHQINWGPLVTGAICNADAASIHTLVKASCVTANNVPMIKVAPGIALYFLMRLMGTCSACGLLDAEVWDGMDSIADWNCAKTAAPNARSGGQNYVDCDLTGRLGKALGRTGRSRMAYAKQARCSLAQDSCHSALDAKDEAALAACLKDALSLRMQCDAGARLDPYPTVGNLFAKEMDVFLGTNSGPASRTGLAMLRAGWVQGLGSLRVDKVNVQLTGAASDVQLRVNATVAPSSAVQLRDVCWNWDNKMMFRVRQDKASKYTTGKQKGRFMASTLQWHLKNSSGLDQKTREGMKDWAVLLKEMGSMGYLQKDPSVETREANTLTAQGSKMCTKLPLTGLRAEMQMDISSLGSGETAGQFSGALRRFTVPLVEQGFHRTAHAQRAVESMLGGRKRFADVFGKIMREAKTVVDTESQKLMKVTCTELRVLCPTCSDEAWECL